MRSPYQWFCYLLLIVLTAPAQAGDSLVFCLEKADVRPWRTQDGGGLNIDLLNLVARKLGLHFEYRSMPWKRCLQEMKDNQVDGAIGASYTEERLAFGAYPGGLKPDAHKRLNMDRYVLVRASGKRANWDGKAFQHLEGAIGIQLGYSVGPYLRGLNIPVDDGTQKPEELIRKLVAGRVSLAAMLEGEVSSLMSADPNLARQVEVLPKALIEKPYFLMLSSAFVTGNRNQAEQLWNTVQTVRNSQEYRALERKAQGDLPR